MGEHRELERHGLGARVICTPGGEDATLVAPDERLEGARVPGLPALHELAVGIDDPVVGPARCHGAALEELLGHADHVLLDTFRRHRVPALGPIGVDARYG